MASRDLRAVATLLAIGMAMLAGCASYKDPAIRITDVVVTDASPEALALGITLELTNPNDEPLSVRQATYDLRVDGKKAYLGTRAGRATIAARQTRQVVIPAVIRFDEAGWTGQQAPATAAYEISGRVRYLGPGEIDEILADSGVLRPSASFKGEGLLDLRLPDGQADR